MYRVTKIRKGKQIVYKKYVAKYEDANGQWKTLTLFSDKAASRAKLNQLQRDADLRTTCTWTLGSRSFVFGRS